MPDYNSGVGNSALGLNRTQRSAREEDRPARNDAHEARQRVGSSQREAHRKAFPQRPTLKVEYLVAQLPDPILRHVSVDDICRETLLLVTLIGKDNVEFV